MTPIYTRFAKCFAIVSMISCLLLQAVTSNAQTATAVDPWGTVGSASFYGQGAMDKKNGIIYYLTSNGIGRIITATGERNDSWIPNASFQADESPNSIVVDNNNGCVYVGGYNSKGNPSHVIKINPSTDYSVAPVINPTWVTLPGFSANQGITIDGFGNVYELNEKPQTLQINKITPAGTLYYNWANTNTISIESIPWNGGLVADALGNVYVGDNNGVVSKIVPSSSGTTGSVTNTWDVGVAALAVDAFNNVYITDGGNIVSKITNTGTLISPYATLSCDVSYGLGNGFTSTGLITCDDNNNVYVSNLNNSAVSLITAQGTLIDPLVTLNSNNTTILTILTDVSGNVYTINNGNATFSKITVTYPTLTPTITDFGPKSACSSTESTVTITGTNFTGATKVTIGETDAKSFQVSQDGTSITATVVADATGIVTVTTTGGSVSSTDKFTKLDAGISTNALTIVPGGVSTLSIDNNNLTDYQIDFGNKYNVNLDGYFPGCTTCSQFNNTKSPLPTGSKVIFPSTNIPFNIKPFSNTTSFNSSGNNAWFSGLNSDGIDAGANATSLTLDIPSSATNGNPVSAVYLLANTFFGQKLVLNNVEFWYNGQKLDFKQDLKGGENLRDYHAAKFTNSLNNNYTVSVWNNNAANPGSNDSIRLDMVKITLPANRLVDKIVINDMGAFQYSRIFVVAATAEIANNTACASTAWSSLEDAAINSLTGRSIDVHPSGNSTYKATLNCGNLTCQQSLTINVANLSITSSSTGTLCNGTPVTFTANVTNGGTTVYNYTWYNGTTPIAGAPDAATYTYTPTVGNTDNIHVQVAITGVVGTLTSNSITPVVSPNVTPSVNITASPSGSVYPNTTVTFTATPTNGGTAPTYQWFNGSTAITGETGSTYSYAPKNGDVISVQLTANNACQSAGGVVSSTGITETIIPIPDITIPTVTVPNTGCPNINIVPVLTNSTVPVGSVPGYVQVIAGTTSNGFANDCLGNVASFNKPVGLCLDASGEYLYVADEYNNQIRKVSTAPGFYTTSLTTNRTLDNGINDGTLSTASFHTPRNITFDQNNNIFYVVNQDDNTIRKIENGQVTTIGGNGTRGTNDGNITSSTFNLPGAITVGNDDYLYISDASGNRLRRMNAHTFEVTTLVQGGGWLANPSNPVVFNNPTSIILFGNLLYVADADNGRIVVIDPATGVLNPLVLTGPERALQQPYAIAADPNNNGFLYVADATSNKILRIDVKHNNTVTQLVGQRYIDAETHLEKISLFPAGIVVDKKGFVYVSSNHKSNIVRIATYGFSISPALPEGLTLNTENGTISGTPTGPTPSGDYVLTYVYAGGSVDNTITLDFSHCNPPTISSITPINVCSGASGTITITGTNFTGATAITIGGIDVTSSAVVTATSITATVPANTTGSVPVVVTTASGSSVPGTATITTLDASITSNRLTINSPSENSVLSVERNTVTDVVKINFSSQCNFNNSTYNATPGAPHPLIATVSTQIGSGDVVLGNQRFNILPWPNTFNAWCGVNDEYGVKDDNPHTLTLNIGTDKHVTALNLLAASIWGQLNSQLVTVKFWRNGETTPFSQKILVGGVDYRNHFIGEYVDNINNNSTINVWHTAEVDPQVGVTGEEIMDKIRIPVPANADGSAQVVDYVTIDDNGSYGTTRIYILAATAEVANNTACATSITWVSTDPSVNGFTTPLITVSPVVTTPYTATLVNCEGKTCTQTLTITVTAPPAPTITDFGPTSGCAGTPTTITIVGSNFTGVTGVTIGGTPAISFEVKDPNTITAIVPANVAGPVVVIKGGVVSNNSTDNFKILNPFILTSGSITPLAGSGLSLQVNDQPVGKFDILDFSNQFNFNISTFGPSNPYYPNVPPAPSDLTAIGSGSKTFNNIPFYINDWSQEHNSWSGVTQIGHPILTLTTNGNSISQLNLIANTLWGNATTANATVFFYYKGTIVAQKDLNGGIETRDYNQARFTNSVNNTTTVNVFTNTINDNTGKFVSTHRLDMIQITIPAQPVDRIVIQDNGSVPNSRLFVIAATVEESNNSSTDLNWSNGSIDLGKSNPLLVAPKETTTYSATLNDGVSTCKADLTINVIPPTATITSSQTGKLCAGSSVKFTATVTGGTASTYTWFNGSNEIIGAPHTATYTYTPAAGNTDIINVQVTFVSATTATSNSITPVITPKYVPTVSVVASQAAILCSGTTARFTAIPPVDAVTPTYKWYNGNTAISGETGTSYSYVPAEGSRDLIRVIMTIANACSSSNPTALSNTLYSTSVAAVTPSVTIISSQIGTICSGGAVTFTPTLTKCGTTPTYQWFNNNVAIDGETKSWYNYKPTVGNADKISLVVSGANNACQTASTASSNSITPVITAKYVPTVSLVASQAAIVCSGTTATFTAIPPIDAVTPTYKWYNGNTVIGGETGTSYSYIPAVGSNNQIRVIISVANVCSSPTVSNTLYSTSSSTVTPSVTIKSSQPITVCNGGAVTFTPTLTKCGTTPTYQWFNNNVAIDGETKSWYNYIPTLGNTDKISLVVSGANYACQTASTATSNSITPVVTPKYVPTVSLVASQAAIVCNGTTATFTAIPPIDALTPTYKWYNGNTAISGETGSSYSYIPVVGSNNQIRVIMTVANACASSALSNSLYSSSASAAYVTPSVTISSSQTGTVCSGGEVTFTSAITKFGTTSTPTYQWFNGNSAVSGETKSTYSYVPLAGNTDAINVVVSGANNVCQTATTAGSTSITPVITAKVAPAVSIAATPSSSVTTGTLVSFAASATNAGSNPTYKWFKGGVEVSGETSATFTYAPANGDLISVQLTANNVCQTASVVNSNVISETVTSPCPVVNPVSGYVGQGANSNFPSLVIKGSGFIDANSVTISGVTVEFKIIDDNTITLTSAVPSTVRTSGLVTVSTLACTGSAAFTLINKPQVLSIVPTNGTQSQMCIDGSRAYIQANWIASGSTSQSFKWYKSSGTGNDASNPTVGDATANYSFLPNDYGVGDYYLSVQMTANYSDGSQITVWAPFQLSIGVHLYPTIGTITSTSSTVPVNGTNILDVIASSASVLKNSSISLQWFENSTSSTNNATAIGIGTWSGKRSAYGGNLVYGKNSITPTFNNTGTYYYYAVVTGTCGATAMSNIIPITVTGDILASLNGIANSKIESSSLQAEIYPNPSRGAATLSLKGVTNKVKVNITGLSGNLVSTYEVNTDSKLKLPSNKLAAGMYLISVNDGTTKKTLKWSTLK